jgi:hypothetical protein
MDVKDNIAVKRMLIEECRRIQQKTVDSTKTAMSEAQQALNEYGPNKDRYDSFRDQLIARRDMFSAQYQKALTEYNTVEKLDPKSRNACVEFGAVVITDKSRFFISISTGKISLDDKVYYAISPNVPLYKVMAGLCKGNEFEFNGMKQKILDLY